MKFSIIMASFNQVDFIEQAIESVLSQTHEDFELIILDGLSTDGSQDIIKQYTSYSNVKIVIEKDQGIYHARNKGLLMATGDVIGFLNTDDFYEQNALQVMNELFVNDLNIDVAYGVINVINKDGKFMINYGDFEFDKEKMIKKNIALPDQVTFFRKKCLPIIGLYDSTFSIISDWDFWQRAMSLDLTFSRTKEHLANYRHYEEALTFNIKFAKKRFRETIRLYRKYNEVCISSFIIKNYYWYYVKRPLKNVSWINKMYRNIQK